MTKTFPDKILTRLIFLPDEYFYPKNFIKQSKSSWESHEISLLFPNEWSSVSDETTRDLLQSENNILIVNFHRGKVTKFWLGDKKFLQRNFPP